MKKGETKSKVKAEVRAGILARDARALSFALLILLSLTAFPVNGLIAAPDFKATDVLDNAVSLNDFRGSPSIIHVTNVEKPVCRECEKSLKGQLKELERLKAQHPEVQLVTLNLRKNPYSDDGKTLAQSWWKVNVTWPWIEDLEPYKIGGLYMNYWEVDGGFSNPALILLDKDGGISKVIHVYKVGEGEVEGVQSAETLYADLESSGSASAISGLIANTASVSSAGEASRQEVTALGMFFLGIITSLAPCSVALMIAMFSYVMISRRREKVGINSSAEGFAMGIAFTLGMASVFFIIGLFVSQMGMFIRDSRLFDLIAGTVMILLGLSNLVPQGNIFDPLTSKLHREKDVENGPGLGQRAVNACVGLLDYSAFVSAFLLGIIFALGWAPCAVSMVFPVLIWLSAQNVTPMVGGTMLLAFGLGHGVPIIPISTFSRTLVGRIGDRYVSAGHWITKIFGLAVIAIGLVYAARYFGFALW